MTQAFIRTSRSFKDIPGPPCYPIIGSWWQYKWGPLDRLKMHQVLNFLYKQYGPLVREKIGNRTLVHVFALDDIKEVYAKESKSPLVSPLQETNQIYRQQKQMSPGLGNINGEEWYKLRSNSQQKMLRPKEVQAHLPSVNQIAKEFVSRMERIRYINNEISDLRTEVGKWSLENGGKLVFDQRLGCFEDDNDFGNKMVAANKKIFEYSGLLKYSLPIYKYISTPTWKMLANAEDLFHSEAIRLTDSAILRIKDAIEQNSLKETDFYLLSYFLSKSELSLKDVTILCLSLFSDGLNTTTPVALYNLYCLAQNPNSQEKLYHEIKTVVGDSDIITEHHINKLSYLKAFIKETFRVYPNSTEISRYSEKEMVLSGYEIPIGTHLDLNPIVHFRNPEIFPNPDQHKPERWIRSNLEEKVHPYLLTPFGHGTRMCIGRRFAEQDLQVLIATILRKFKLEYPAGEDLAQVYHTLLFPDRPVRVRFVNRT